MEANVPVENKKNLLGELQKSYLEKLQRAAETTRTRGSKIPNSKGYNRCRGELAFAATQGHLPILGMGQRLVIWIYLEKRECWDKCRKTGRTELGADMQGESDLEI